jgi:antitoxin YobK
MSIEDVDQALALIAEHRDEGTFAGPADDATIERAEALLGLTFPPTYRRFLRHLGAGDIWGEEFYGIVDEELEEPLVPNVVGLALAERSAGSLPVHLLPVYALGDGTIFGLDFSATLATNHLSFPGTATQRPGLRPRHPTSGPSSVRCLNRRGRGQAEHGPRDAVRLGSIALRWRPTVLSPSRCSPVRAACRRAATSPMW